MAAFGIALLLAGFACAIWIDQIWAKDYERKFAIYTGELKQRYQDTSATAQFIGMLLGIGGGTTMTLNGLGITKETGSLFGVAVFVIVVWLMIIRGKEREKHYKEAIQYWKDKNGKS